MSWGDVNGATNYEVDRFNGVGWDVVDDDLPSNATSFHDMNRASGTSFTYRVEAIDATGPSIPTTPASAFTRPDVVANFSATAQSSSEIDLAWTGVNGATGYRVMQSVNGDPYSQIDDTPTPGYQNTGLDEGTDYSYEIIAYDNGGDGAPTSAQDAVTNLKTPDFISTGATNSSVSLQWTNHSAADTSYEVDQYIDGSWVDVHDGGAIVVDGNTGSTTIGSLAEATTYQFQVTALGPDGAASIPQQITVSTAPNDPTDLTASPFSTTSIDLSWTNNSANADYYSIERADAAGDNWTQIDTTDGDASSYADSTVTEATTYQYRVAAVKGSSASGYATTPGTVTTFPLAPTGLTSTAVSATEIDLNWTDRSADPTAYRIYRATDGFSYARPGSDLAADATSFQDMSAPDGATTYYIVVAVDDAGESSASARTNATTPLAAPSNVLAATTTSTSTGDKTVDLSWTNNSTAATSISIERGVDGVYAPLTTLAASATSYSDDTALENTTYTYRVWAIKGQVSSVHAASNFVTTLLSRATSVSLSSPTATSITISWTDISAAATAYYVYRSGDGVTFTDTGAMLNGAANSFTDTGLTEGTPYYYRVRAATDGNSSNYSGVATLTTIPATPTLLAATPFSTTEINLTWNDVSTTNTSYTVERSPDGSSWMPAATGLDATATSYNDTGLVEGTNYEYEVFAVGAGGDSLASDIVPATTIPLAPDTLVAATVSTTEISLTWNNNSANATHYLVERSVVANPYNFHQIALLGQTATSYNDSSLTEGTDVLYRVRAQDAGGYSAYSNSVEAFTLPAMPSGLTATPTSGQIALAWTDNSGGETSYTVERQDSGVWVQIANLPPDSNAFTDTGNNGNLSTDLVSGQMYDYRVYCSNGGGDSDFAAVSATAA